MLSDRFEPGALGQLCHAANLTSLHLEVLTGRSISSSRASPASPSTAVTPSGPSRSPSELARLQAADEVGLGKMGTQLLSFTAVGFSSPSTFRPVAALLAAVSGSPKPRLLELQLGAVEVSGQLLTLVASISSLSSLKLLPGCDVVSPLDLGRLSALGGLTQLLVAPCVMPPPPVLAAWSKGCKRLIPLGVCGQPALGPLTLTPATMQGVTELQLLGPTSSHSTLQVGGISSNGSGRTNSSAGCPFSVDVASLSLAVTLQSPLSLSGLPALWPSLISLEVVGWAVDAAGVAALKQLEHLANIRLQGGSDPSTALHVHLLLPLLQKRGLQRLVLQEASGLDDDWVFQALMHLPASATSGGDGPCCAQPDGNSLHELHLGAATANSSMPATPSGSSSLTGSDNKTVSSVATVNPTMTDAALVKLATWPNLTTLVLTGLPCITLAGVKALVAGSSISLAELFIQGCPAVAAAPPDVIARVAVAPGGARAVDLRVC